MKALKALKDRIEGKATKGQRRSGRWPGVRKRYLQTFGECAVCGGKDKLEVHHLKPFQEAPELELDPGNLVTLCESRPWYCHLIFGHLGDYRAINLECRQDVLEWAAKVQTRKKGNK
jgi:hypothetical protein